MGSQHHLVSTTNRVHIRRAILSIAALGLSAPAFASTLNFIPGIGTGSPTPAGTANWTDPNSWAGTVSGATAYVVPGASDQASSSTSATTIIDSAVPIVNEVRFANIAPGSNDYTITGGGASYPSTGVATLTIASTGSLSIQSTNGTSNGSLTIGNAIGTTGTLNINGGSLSTGGSAMTTESLGGLESLVIAGSASSATVAGPVAYFNMNDGTVNVANNFFIGYGASVNATSVAFALGTTTQTGGTINVAGGVIVGARGHGGYTMTGGSLIQSGTNGDAPVNSLGRDAFYIGQSDITGTSGNPQGGKGFFAQAGTAQVSIANGLYIANQSNTTGTYSVSGGTLSVAGDISVGAALGAGVGNAAPVAATNNSGLFQVNSNAAATITANHLTADTANSTLGFAIDSSAGTSLIRLTAGNGFDGSAELSSSTSIDIDPLSSFSPAPGSVYTLLTATSISALPTLTLDGDAFDTSTLSIITNGDGTQSLIDSFAAATRLTGDTNGDGVVDLTDLNNVLNNFGVTATGNPGDDNMDGTVDLTDLNDVLNNFGTHTPVASALSIVPEPTTLSLLSFGAATLLTRRRRA